MNQTKTWLLLAAMTSLFAAAGFAIGGANGMIAALGIGVAMNFFAYWNSDKAVLSAYRAIEVGPDHPEPVIATYARDTLEMAAKAGLPPPRVYVIENDQPNAFATGRNPENAAVAATTGLLSLLTREEIAGVMAHELAHVKNRDTLVMTVSASIAGAIGWLGTAAMIFRDGEDRPNPLAAMLAMIVAPMAAMVVQMTISRGREYGADAMGAQIAGNPEWLASALRKIEQGARAAYNPQAERNPATAHMFIINPLAGGFRDNLFSTHPATANRVEALMQMAATDPPGNALDLPEGRAPAAGRAGPWGAKPKGPWG